MKRFLVNAYNLFKLMLKADFICNQDCLTFHYKGSTIHLDNLGNLSIVPKGLLLNHCTYQEVLENVGSSETKGLCDKTMS